MKNRVVNINQLHCPYFKFDRESHRNDNEVYTGTRQPCRLKHGDQTDSAGGRVDHLRIDQDQETNNNKSRSYFFIFFRIFLKKSNSIAKYLYR